MWEEGTVGCAVPPVPQVTGLENAPDIRLLRSWTPPPPSRVSEYDLEKNDQQL